MRKVDAVVIGAGAGGGVVAKELATHGLSVVVLERGRWAVPMTTARTICGTSAPQSWATTAVRTTTGTRAWWSTCRAASASCSPSQPGYSNNAACVGGGTLTYGAMAWRYHPNDFRMRSTYGAPRRQHARRLADRLRRPRAVLRKSRMGDRRLRRRLRQSVQGRRAASRCPCRRCRRRGSRSCCKPAAERLGLHPFDIPMLRNSVPYNGRRGCMRCRWCVGFPCEVNAKCGTQNTVIPDRARHRQLRTAHRRHGEGDPVRCARPRDRRRLLR